MKSFYLMICSPTKIEKMDRENLLNALRKANHRSLCVQYGLDHALIKPALRHLDLLVPPYFSVARYFVLKYRADDRSPIVIHCDYVDEKSKWNIFQGLDQKGLSPALRAELEKTRTVFWMSLTQNQMTDMGILLAYEIVRWILEQEGGILRGLDGCWYRLNRHSAFLEIKG